jgi:hypothetical protein
MKFIKGTYKNSVLTSLETQISATETNRLIMFGESVAVYCEKLKLKLKLKLIYDRQSVGQSVLVSGVLLGSATNFSFPLKFLSDSCGFVML